jgi:hypothetical protein
VAIRTCLAGDCYAGRDGRTVGRTCRNPESLRLVEDIPVEKRERKSDGPLVRYRMPWRGRDKRYLHVEGEIRALTWVDP